MNIGLARRVDFWVGIPGCFVLSIFSFFSEFIFKKKPLGRSGQKILFIKLSELGAIILAYPLLSKIKAENPSAQLFFLTFETNKNVFRFLGGVVPSENILCLRMERAFFMGDIISVIRRLRREKIDIVLDLEFFVRFSAILAYFSGAKKRIGFYPYGFEGLYRGDFWTHKISYNPLNHITKTYLSMGQAIREDEKKTPEMEGFAKAEDFLWPAYQSEAVLRARMKERLLAKGIGDEQNVFLLHPGDGILPLREWPLEYCVEISKRLLENKKNCVVIVGTQDAFVKGQSICKEVNHPRCLDFSGTTSLAELMELLGLSRALISNDCGMAHLAMLSPVRIFVVFGPESPQVFAPLGKRVRVFYSQWPCSPCLSVLNHRRSFCQDNVCLRVIQPEDVYKVIQEECL